MLLYSTISARRLPHSLFSVAEKVTFVPDTSIENHPSPRVLARNGTLADTSNEPSNGWSLYSISC